jgi:hypothetical protein
MLNVEARLTFRLLQLLTPAASLYCESSTPTVALLPEAVEVKITEDPAGVTGCEIRGRVSEPNRITSPKARSRFRNSDSPDTEPDGWSPD